MNSLPLFATDRDDSIDADSTGTSPNTCAPQPLAKPSSATQAPGPGNTASGGPETDASCDHPLLRSLSLENLVRQREAVLERLNQAITLVREAYAIASAAHLGAPRIGIHHLSRHPTDFTDDDATETARQQVDFGGWDYLMSESGLISLRICWFRRS